MKHRNETQDGWMLADGSVLPAGLQDGPSGPRVPQGEGPRFDLSLPADRGTWLADGAGAVATVVRGYARGRWDHGAPPPASVFPAADPGTVSFTPPAVGAPSGGGAPGAGASGGGWDHAAPLPPMTGGAGQGGDAPPPVTLPAPGGSTGGSGGTSDSSSGSAGGGGVAIPLPEDEGGKTSSGWNASWREVGPGSPCGTCTGRFCTVCSIRTGGSSGPGGMPTGYSPSILDYYDTSTSTATTSTLLATQSVTAAALPANPNAIVLENQKQGTPESEWMIYQADSSIEGYAAQFSLDHGETVDFKINTDSTDYRIDIYRLGYYNGDGARLVDSISRSLTTAQVQPDPLFDPTTKLVDAGNWSVSASWDIPSDAVSGLYIAELVRLDGSGGRNMIPFVVRDDEAPSDVTFQTSDTTWQAYNWWGGYNFYGGIDADGREGRASALSYNRPFITRDGGFAAGPQDYIFGAEYPTIRWLEQNGYSVNYISGIDTDRDPAQLLNSQIFLSVGHDEYWSAAQRSAVEAARDAGVNLAFWSGNEVYWEVRWEDSIDGSGTPYRTLVSYKERWDNADTDPGYTTSTWRDPELGAGQPENGLTGTIFTVDSYRLDSIDIPYDLSNFRFWSNTAVADIQPGEVYQLTQNLLGYEWDSDLDNGARPDGLIQLSSTTVDVQTLLYDYGNTTGDGTATHALTLYRAPSGALVFGAGTVYWSWGLDSHHDNEATPTDPNVQQAMVNLFAEMGVQPETLMTSLMVADQSTDTIAPTSQITGFSGAATLSAGQPVVITGTATDSGGGLVAVVEVSTDGGTSWHRATGYESWTYDWTPLTGGTYQILSRAVDDSVNMESGQTPTQVTVEAAPTYSIFSLSDVPAVTSSTDASFVNLGTSFTVDQSGSIVGLRYYKGLGDGGTHEGAIWSSTGTLLRSATFEAESDSGWQTVTFSSPVQVTAGVTYIAAYTSHGHYASTENFFSGSYSSGPFTLSAQNGFYTQDSNLAFPSTATSNTNYWVDVIFSPTNTVNEVPVGVNDDGFVTSRDQSITFSAATLLANDSDPNGDILSITGVGSAVNGTVSYDAASDTITFTPTAGFTGAAHFGYAITDGRGGVGSAFVNLNVLAPFVTLFSASDTPADLKDSDPSSVTLGMRFTASVAGTISGIRVYRGVGDTGSHTGSLWSATGTLLATGTFADSPSEGWQTLVFASPIAIAAGTTYVASFRSNGHYTATSGYFSSTVSNGVLSTASGANGVYSYDSGNPFPTQSYNNTNYWVDVMFTASSGANIPPTATADSGFTTQQDTALQITAASLLANDSDANGDTLTLTGVSGASNGTVAYNAQTGVVTFTPTAGFSGAAGFSYSISDGNGGSASTTVSLTVNATGGTGGGDGQSLFTTGLPATASENDPNAVELGMKFTASVDGTVSAIRFYKGTQNTGTHTGSLWTSTGTLLGNVTFTGETGSGWQVATFATPISITAGTTYVASYHTNTGYYAADGNYFSSTVTNGALSAPAGSNGVYAYGGGGIFPSGSYNSTNYWVDVVFNAGAAAPNVDPVANPDSGYLTTPNTALQISAASLLANDTDANGDALSVTGVSNATNGTVSYNAQTATVTFTPAQDYQGSAGFSYAIADGKGGTASAAVTLNVAQAAPAQSLFAASATPAVANVNDPNSVELGMKFTSTTAGTVTGVKFYKGSQNTGTHTGSLWTSTGTLLGDVTFTNETASGWQSANFNTPISIAANTTYVVSYHSSGYYSADGGYFGSATTSGNLTAPSSSTSGGNGVYAYGSSSLFPSNTYNSSNYWVDVIFNGQLVA